MGFCECTTKFALFAFNLICAILGLVIVGVTVAVLLHARPLKEVVSSQISTVNIILIVVGVLVFLIAFLGCCGAVRESNCMLTTYAVILSTLLIIQFALGITAFVYKGKIEGSIESTIDKIFENDDTLEVVNSIQSNLQCCGTDGPGSWASLMVPGSCCGRAKDQSCVVAEAYADGCTPKIIATLNKSLKIVGGVAIGICVVELICVIFAFCLASVFKRKYMYG